MRGAFRSIGRTLTGVLEQAELLGDGLNFSAQATDAHHPHIAPHIHLPTTAALSYVVRYQVPLAIFELAVI